MAESGEPLSDREFEILQCAAKGVGNKQIAQDLNISPNTVKVHLRNIYTKLGATSRTEATRIALEQGLLAVPGQDEEVLTTTAPVEGMALSKTAVSSPAANSTNITIPAERSPANPSSHHVLFRITVISLFLLIMGFVGLVALQNQDNTTPTPPSTHISPTPIPSVEKDLGENWHASRDMPQAVGNMAIVANGLHILQIGGETDSGVGDAVNIYDTVALTWSTGVKKPTAVADISAAILFGEIYVPGGRRKDGQLTNVVEVYSPTNDAWREVSSLPQPMSGGLTLSDGSFLYYFGGRDGTAYQNSAYLYDAAANSWRPLPEMHFARTDAAGASTTGQLYVVGGKNSDGELDVCEFYDLTSNLWTTCANMLQPRAGASADFLINRLYVFGGIQEDEALITLSESYDPQRDEWSLINTPMNELESSGWTDVGATRVETRIFVLGGRRFDNSFWAKSFVFSPLFRIYLPSAATGDGN
jgi:DNA-binding CsgD family transcriptional regulator/N-acetylneuraminic acid mutarotase